MNIHLLQVLPRHSLRTNKDTNGGFGTVNDYGRGLAAVFLKTLKRSTMNFPEILPAYVQAILKSQDHRVTFALNQVDPSADLVLIQTSIVNYSAELEWAAQIKLRQPGTRVGFIGGMSAGNPQRYLDQGDFVIAGEAEGALLDRDIGAFSGLVQSPLVDNLDRLPFPDWSHVQNNKGGYGLRLGAAGRFLPALSSRGCSMSCAYYCTYPLVQGASFRARSPENVVDELVYLQKQFGMQVVMFRDPIFSLKMGRVQQICELILQRGLRLSWICETHPRFLNAELVGLMKQAGCTAVKLGIEAGDLDVMQKSRRAAPDLEYQEEIVRVLEQQGIKVLAFYILGYFDDDRASILRTMAYAEQLNTYGAQFTIATPYPGTPWYAELAGQPERYQLDETMEHYNQYRLVYNHPKLRFAELEDLKSLAYRRYYFRAGYVRRHFLKS